MSCEKSPTPQWLLQLFIYTTPQLPTHPEATDPFWWGIPSCIHRQDIAQAWRKVAALDKLKASTKQAESVGF